MSWYRSDGPCIDQSKNMQLLCSEEWKMSEVYLVRCFFGRVQNSHSTGNIA